MKKTKNIPLLAALICLMIMSCFKGIEYKDTIKKVYDYWMDAETAHVDTHKKTTERYVGCLAPVIILFSLLEILILSKTVHPSGAIVSLILHVLGILSIFGFKKLIGPIMSTAFTTGGHLRTEYSCEVSINTYGRVFIAFGAVVGVLYLFEIISRLKKQGSNADRQGKKQTIEQREPESDPLAGIEIPPGRE